MQALLDYLETASIPLNDRPNVSNQPAVRSITIGMVNKRQAGYGISSATTADRLRLLQLLVGVANDSGFTGDSPECFTSICLNVDFASEVHTDSHNSGPSWIVAGGEYSGGRLFIERDDDQEDQCSIEYAGSHINGVAVDIKNSWYKFNGSNRHGTLPYSGYRVSVVFFSVPAARCDTADLARLKHLGFKIPYVSPLSVFKIPLPWPYYVFICSTRRHATIVQDTLAILFDDGSIPPHAVTLCVKDEDDRRSYEHLNLRMLVSEDANGLPEQRAMCVRYMPRGSWALFMDDDVTRVQKPDHLSMHELVMLGFLSAQQRHVHLWGLNVSANPRNLRDCYSSRLGLVNGYFFGVIANQDLRGVTRTSDQVGGAAEDIERSLRYYVHSGLLRLNFATACAKNKSNTGGLQHHYASSDHRKAAHTYVLHVLAAEFPNHIAIDTTSPNGCKFIRASATNECHIPEVDAGSSSAADSNETTDCSDANGSKEADTSVSASPPSCALSRCKILAKRRKCCSMCDRAYARAADLRHHMRTVHNCGAPIDTCACPVCSQVFRRHKDMVVHVKMQRCHSHRGRPHAALVAASSSGGLYQASN